MEWTGEQIVEAVMTNGFVRAIEMFAPALWIWFTGQKQRKDAWTKPVMIGFVLIVLAASLSLEERLTGIITSFTYSDERVVRGWLDEQHLPSSPDPEKDDIFRYRVTGPFAFAIFRSKATPETLTLMTNIRIKPDILDRTKLLPEPQRNRFMNDIFMELSRQNIYLPTQRPPGSDLAAITVQQTFPFPRGTTKAALYGQLSNLKRVQYVVDLVYSSWIAQGKI